MDETELIRRVLDGDPAAERALYEAHADRVFRLAFRMAGDEELARDYTQEVFIRAFSHLEGFRGDAAISTWLHRITVTVTLNGLRKVKRRRERELELDEELDRPHENPGRAEPDLRESLREAIDGLPEHQRLVFVMHELEGYTHEEIGGALEIATGTSKARLSRARARLRDELAEFAEEYMA